MIMADRSTIELLAETTSRRRARSLLQRAAWTKAGLRSLWLTAGTDGIRPPDENVHDGGIVMLVDLRTGGATWRGSVITIPGTLPDTVATAMIGRDAGLTLDHPLCRGRIVETVHRRDDETVIALKPEYVSLGGPTPMILFDLLRDLRTWAKLRGMALREESIDAEWMKTTKADHAAAEAQLVAQGLLLFTGLFLMIGWTTIGRAGLGAIAATAPVAIAAISIAWWWWRRFEFTISDDAMILPPWWRRRLGMA